MPACIGLQQILVGYTYIANILVRKMPPVFGFEKLYPNEVLRLLKKERRKFKSIRSSYTTMQKKKSILDQGFFQTTKRKRG